MSEEKAEHTGRFVRLDSSREGFPMRDVMGPFMVDHSIRQAIMHCWMILPEEERSLERLEGQILRLVHRALKDAKEDLTAFGISETREGKDSA